ASGHDRVLRRADERRRGDVQGRGTDVAHGNSEVLERALGDVAEGERRGSRVDVRRGDGTADISREREAGAAVDIGPSRHNDIPVRLHRNGKRQVIATREIGGHFATRAEAGVERAVAVVTCQGEVVYERTVRWTDGYKGFTHDDDLPVPLQSNGIRLRRHVIAAREIGRHFATRAEAGVERAVAVVACETEVEASVEVLTGRSRRHDLAVRLDGN